MGFLTTNRTSFHEWAAASPEDFIFGFIRVYSLDSWFECAEFGHLGRRGSFAFPADQDA